MVPTLVPLVVLEGAEGHEGAGACDQLVRELGLVVGLLHAVESFCASSAGVSAERRGVDGLRVDCTETEHLCGRWGFVWMEALYGCVMSFCSMEKGRSGRAALGPFCSGCRLLDGLLQALCGNAGYVSSRAISVPWFHRGGLVSKVSDQSIGCHRRCDAPHVTAVLRILFAVVDGAL